MSPKLEERVAARPLRQTPCYDRMKALGAVFGIVSGMAGYDVTSWYGFSLAAGTPQPIVDRLSELCVAANSDPKVKEILRTFALEPAIGFKESNALYQRELPVWMETANRLGLEPA